VTFDIRVEKAVDLLEIGRRLLASRPDPRITSGLDLADEQQLLVAYLVHGLHRPPLARLHSRHSEVVHRHSISRIAMLYVEP